jgi:prophage regulatory protein
MSGFDIHAPQKSAVIKLRTGLSGDHWVVSQESGKPPLKAKSGKILLIEGGGQLYMSIDKCTGAGVSDAIVRALIDFAQHSGVERIVLTVVSDNPVATDVALASTSPRHFKRTIRRTELRRIVPLADTTIYELEQRGEFPRRFNLTARCVVWDLAEVEAWLDQRREASESAQIARAPSPDVRRRKTRPVRQ